MLKIYLLALPWMVDPAVGDRNSQMIATCSRPVVTVTMPSAVAASRPSQIVDARTISNLLRKWERATRNAPEWSRSQREVFRKQIHEDFNEHSVAAAEQLVGQVNESRLCEMYHWRIVDRTRDCVCLEATPRDDTERLFYAALRVTITTGNWTPEQIVVVGRNQVARVAWLSETVPKKESLQLVRFESDVPPSPSGFLRTANARGE